MNIYKIISEYPCETLIVRIIAIVLAFIGSAYFFFVSIQLSYSSQQSQKWASVNGIILKSEVKHDTGSLIAERDTFNYKVLYEYILDEQKYIGNKVTFNPYDTRSDNIKKLNIFVDRYPVGAIVDVYYNPKDLNTSVLEPGLSKKSNNQLYIALVFCCIGTFFFINILTGFGESLLQFLKI